MNRMPERKRIRLSGYNYSYKGAYFITICVKDKHEMLGTIDVGAATGRPHLSDYGKIVDEEISALPIIYDFVDIDKYVIMPNHIHMIIVLDSDGRTQFAPTISRIVKQFKGSITKQIGFSPWQKSFHDHIIRSEDDYNRICKYIDKNPTLWTEDYYYPKNHQPTQRR